MNFSMTQQIVPRLFIAVLVMSAVLFSPGSSIAEEDDGRLSAIGGLSAAHMYTTYIAIGAVADAFGNDVYDTEASSRYYEWLSRDD